jgi:hypothetical protein
MSDDKRAGMQRVRVGLTGLGAVLLIVAISAAIFETARQQPSNSAAPANQTEATVANMIGNTVEAPSEPLAEMGVTPGAAPAGNGMAEIPPSEPLAEIGVTPGAASAGNDMAAAPPR